VQLPRYVGWCPAFGVLLEDGDIVDVEIPSTAEVSITGTGLEQASEDFCAGALGFRAPDLGTGTLQVRYGELSLVSRYEVVATAPFVRMAVSAWEGAAIPAEISPVVGESVPVRVEFVGEPELRRIPSWVELVPREPGIVNVSETADGAVMTGIGAGATMLDMRVAADLEVWASAHVFVGDADAAFRFAEVFVLDSDAVVAGGACHEVMLVGRFELPEAFAEFQRILDDSRTTWTVVSGDARIVRDPLRLCPGATSGPIQLRFDDPDYGTNTTTVLSTDARTVDQVVASPATVTASLTGPLSRYRTCLPIRINTSFADGSSEDVTRRLDSVELELLVEPVPPFFLTDMDGFSDAGDPCFLLPPYLDPPPTEGRFQFLFNGVRSNVVVVSWM
jgi:hypothetical protein